jgi:hypothetical protein
MEKTLKTKKINYNKLYNNLQYNICLKKEARKFHFDSMLKKLKSKTFKAIHKCIRTCLNENYILKRIPQKFITDIKIESNKIIFKKTIREIWRIFCPPHFLKYFNFIKNPSNLKEIKMN